MYYIRAALDGISARLAATNLMEQEKEHLLQLCDEMEKQYQLGNFQKFLEINLQFHEIIYKATHSSQLQDLLFQYYNLSEQYRS